MGDVCPVSWAGAGRLYGRIRPVGAIGGEDENLSCEGFQEECGEAISVKG